MELRDILSLMILFFSLSACKKESAAGNEIYGKWFQDRQSFHEVFDLRQDGVVEIITSVIDRTNNKILGYVSRSTGSYSLKGDSVIIKDLKIYIQLINGYTPPEYKKSIEELPYSATINRTAYRPVFSENNRVLTLLFNCASNADCVPYPKLSRVK
jgi:hypothetical protein